MNLNEWFDKNKSDSVRLALARECSTTIGYLLQVRSNPNKNASPDLCKRLEEATRKITPDTVVLPKDQRPDIAAIFCSDCSSGNESSHDQERKAA